MSAWANMTTFGFLCRGEELMKRAGLIAAICIVLLAAVSSAQSMDGKWTTGLHARGTDGQVITLTLKSDGSKVTGTLYGSQPIPLEGTIEGNTLRLSLKLTTVNGGERLVNYIATLNGDELKFTHQSEDGRLPVFGPAAKEFTA